MAAKWFNSLDTNSTPDAYMVSCPTQTKIADGIYYSGLYNIFSDLSRSWGDDLTLMRVLRHPKVFKVNSQNASFIFWLRPLNWFLEPVQNNLLTKIALYQFFVCEMRLLNNDIYLKVLSCSHETPGIHSN